MNLKSLLLLLFILLVSTGYSQQRIVNKSIDVLETKISIREKYPQNGRLYCYDIIKKDTITIYITKAGLESSTFKLILINGKIVPKVVKCTDYPAYDGMSCFDFENDKYTLEINDTVFKPGDTLKAKFTILTKTHKYSEKKKLTGEIFHIIGGNQYEWNNGKSIKNRWWKNGEQVFTIQESKED